MNIGSRYTPNFAANVLRSKTTKVPATLQVDIDNVALEPPLLTAITATVGGSSDFVVPLNITILDGDGELCGMHACVYM